MPDGQGQGQGMWRIDSITRQPHGLYGVVVVLPDLSRVTFTVTQAGLDPAAIAALVERVIASRETFDRLFPV